MRGRTIAVSSLGSAPASILLEQQGVLRSTRICNQATGKTDKKAGHEIGKLRGLANISASLHEIGKQKCHPHVPKPSD